MSPPHPAATTDTVAIWYERPAVLLDSYMEFVPTKNGTYVQQLNSVVRFSIYFAVLTFLIRKDTNVFLAPLAVMLLTWTMHRFDRSPASSSGGARKTGGGVGGAGGPSRPCRPPSADNPFMNPMFGTGGEDVQNMAGTTACDVTKPRVKQMIEDNFDRGLKRSTGDLWRKHSSDRQYYTMPCTDVVSDQNRFSKWLYSDVGSRKNVHPKQ